MPMHIDLDFKETQCKTSVSILLIFLIVLTTSGIYFFVESRKKIDTIKKEANILLKKNVVPKGLIKINKKEKVLLSVDGKNYIIDPLDTIVLNGIKLCFNITDTTFTIKTTHFEKRVKW